MPLRIRHRKERNSPTPPKSLLRKATARTTATKASLLPSIRPKTPLADEADAVALMAVAAGAMPTLTATVEAAAVEAVAADGAEASEDPSEAVPALAAPEALLITLLLPTLPLTSPA